MEIILALVQQAMEKYPQVVSILVVIGALRVVLKPLMAVLQSYVDYTVDPKDNELLAKILDSAPYKALAYALDLLGSIKLPAKK
jgi:hypothetical protein